MPLREARTIRALTAVARADALLEARNRLFASARFQRLASRLPLTRWIARRRARRLFDLCAGFVYSQVLLACVELGVFDLLARGPQSVDAIAGRIGLPPEGAARLLRAAASLGLLEPRRGGRFGLGGLGAALGANPGIFAMVEHHRLLYADIADPVALLRGKQGPTELSRYWSYAGNAGAELEEEDVVPYSALMSASQSLVADQILDAYGLEGHRCLLDVGGGEGFFLGAVAERAPHLRLVLFDLPAVAERARARFAKQPWAERVSVVGGDFLRDPLPAGADVVSLVRVVLDHEDDAALAILRSVRRALPADGVLLLAEPMPGTSRPDPVGDAYFGFYLLAMGSGRARTPEELEALLRSAGFDDFRRVATRIPVQTRLLVARPSRDGAAARSRPWASSRGSAERNQGE